jgi:hypothetical protein
LSSSDLSEAPSHSPAFLAIDWRGSLAEVFAFSRGEVDRFFADHVAEFLEVQLVNPILHRQLPLLLWIWSGSNQAVRPEAQILRHGDIILVQPAQLLCFGPIVLLRFLVFLSCSRASKGL